MALDWPTVIPWFAFALLASGYAAWCLASGQQASLFDEKLGLEVQRDIKSMTQGNAG